MTTTGASIAAQGRPPMQHDNIIDFSKPLDTSLLHGINVFITGAAGLGLGAATALAEAGAWVTIADINAAAGKAAEEKLKGRGLKVQFVETDVVSYESQLHAIKAAIAFHPNQSLDLVIPCAGIAGTSLLSDVFPQGLEPGADPPRPSAKVLDVNLTGVYYTAVLALHYFKVTRDRLAANVGPANVQGAQSRLKQHLLFVASTSAYTSLPLSADYTASKFAVRGIFMSIRNYGPTVLGDVRINLIAPWFIQTGLVAGIQQHLQSGGVRFGDVEDFVAGAMRCCCDETINGRAMVVTPKELGSDVAGSGNFDVRDEPEGGHGAVEFYKRMPDGPGVFFESSRVDIGKLWGYGPAR